MDEVVEQLLTELENEENNKEKIDQWFEEIDSVLSHPMYAAYVHFDDRAISNDTLTLLETKSFFVWKHADGVTAIGKTSGINIMQLVLDGFYQYTVI